MNIKQITLLILMCLTAPDTLQAETSAEARKRKTILFNGHVGILAHPSIAGSAGVFLSEDLTLEAHISASTNLMGEESHHMGSVRSRYFFGNSIYGLVGLGGRSYRHDTRDTDDDYNEFIGEETYIRDIGVEVAMGNMWTLRSFNIGLDWFWAYVPTHTASRVYRKYDEFGDIENTDKSTTGHYAPPIVVAPRLNIGFSF